MAERRIVRVNTLHWRAAHVSVVSLLHTPVLSNSQLETDGGVQKLMLGKLVDFSIKWVGGVPLVH